MGHKSKDLHTKHRYDCINMKYVHYPNYPLIFSCHVYISNHNARHIKLIDVFIVDKIPRILQQGDSGGLTARLGAPLADGNLL